MVDTLAPKGIIGVMTPAMNTVVQPELEWLRPEGVTNQMQRFRLGGEAISDDLIEEAEKLMDCQPLAIAVGLTTDAGLAGWRNWLHDVLISKIKLAFLFVMHQRQTMLHCVNLAPSALPLSRPLMLK